MKLVGNRPAALEGYLSLNSALGKGGLGAKTGERIALAIAEINRCNYCLSAHTYLACNVAKLDAAKSPPIVTVNPLIRKPMQQPSDSPPVWRLSAVMYRLRLSMQ
jgi:AhpD family alkylhydroperoxidase